MRRSIVFHKSLSNDRRNVELGILRAWILVQASVFSIEEKTKRRFVNGACLLNYDLCMGFRNKKLTYDDIFRFNFCTREANSCDSCSGYRIIIELV